MVEKCAFVFHQLLNLHIKVTGRDKKGTIETVAAQNVHLKKKKYIEKESQI